MSRTCAHPDCSTPIVGRSTRRWCSDRCRKDARARERFWSFYKAVGIEVARRSRERRSSRVTQAESREVVPTLNASRVLK